MCGKCEPIMVLEVFAWVCVWWVGGEHAQGPNKQKDSGHSQKHEIYNDIPKYSTF